MPDHEDSDSDNDGIDDLTEGEPLDANGGLAELVMVHPTVRRLDDDDGLLDEDEQQMDWDKMALILRPHQQRSVQVLR